MFLSVLRTEFMWLGSIKLSTLERKALSWSQDAATLHMLPGWAVRDSKYSSADRTRKHLDGKSAPEDFGLPTSSTSAIGRGCVGRHWWLSLRLGGWDEIYQTRSYSGKNFSQHKCKKTPAHALYIILNKSAHAPVLQRVQHLSFTHLSLLRSFSPREHLRIAGGGKRREPSFLHRNFHALGSVNYSITTSLTVSSLINV